MKKKVKLIFLFLFISFIFLAPSCIDKEPPYFIGLTFSVTSENSVSIIWSTNEEATAQVEYGLTTDYGMETEIDSNLIKDHKIELNNLIPGEIYHFRAISVDKYGNKGVSIDDNFIATREEVSWETATPESQGVDPYLLQDVKDYAQNTGSEGVVIVINGYLIAEWYWNNWDKSTTQRGYSVAKSFTSALIGICIDEGFIEGIDQKASDFIKEWQGTENEKIKIHHLLTMTSGLDTKGNARFASYEDQAAYARSLKLEKEPGTSWTYLNTGSMILSEIVREASGVEAEDLAEERIFKPLGMINASWMRDSVGHTLGYQSVVTSARGFAKFGQLYLNKGKWGEKQIVSSDWVELTTKTSQELNRAYGMHWWTNTYKVLVPSAPEDTFIAMGYEEKRIYVIPKYNLVSVRLGQPSEEWNDNKFLSLIIDAIER